MNSFGDHVVQTQACHTSLLLDTHAAYMWHPEPWGQLCWKVHCYGRLQSLHRHMSANEIVAFLQVGSTGLSDEAARKFATCMVASFALLARQKRQKELQQMADQP